MYNVETLRLHNVFLYAHVIFGVRHAAMLRNILEGRLVRLTVLLRHYVFGARIEETSEQDAVV